MYDLDKNYEQIYQSKKNQVTFFFKLYVYFGVCVCVLLYFYTD